MRRGTLGPGCVKQISSNIGSTKMSVKADAVSASLKKHVAYLQPAVHDEILAGLRADGLVEDGGAVHAAAARLQNLRHMTAAQAAAAYPEAVNRLKRVKAMAARMGFQFGDTDKIDTFALDQALRGQPLERRMELKAELASLHLIP
jgi:hypothetical protein